MKWFWTKKGTNKIQETLKDAKPLDDLQGVPEFDPTGLAVNAFTKDPKVKITIAAIKYAWEHRRKELQILKNVKNFIAKHWHLFEELLIVLLAVAVIIGIILTLTNCATICKP